MKTIIIRGIAVPVEKAFRDGLDYSVESFVRDRLGTSEFEYAGLCGKSIDARRKTNIKYVVSAKARVDDGFDAVGRGFVVLQKPARDVLIKGGKTLVNPPVIAGSGPCGLFCAYLLARNGFSPLVIERGEAIDERKKSVRDFWKTGNLDPESNVQFGEGGAGTFSDGKLVTRINDPRCSLIEEILMENGAPASISYEAKPHIGTDILSNVIKNIRDEIISLGGKFQYDSRLSGVKVRDGVLKAVEVNDEYEIRTDVLVLAVGHSARDTYRMLLDAGVEMEQKPFSAGLRIEHLQTDVNYSQWGEQSKYMDEAAEYSLNQRTGNRTAYTFCMCPGGVVVNASSEQGFLSINGMSYSKRKGRNANSAWVAEVRPSDLGSSDPMAGVEFQRRMEEAAYIAGGGGFTAPVQLLGDFIKGRTGSRLGRVRPAFTGRTAFAELGGVLPEFISGSLRMSLGGFAGKLPFFIDEEAVLTGCETRTSSPLRIKRNEDFISVSHNGVYPAGEGAGYSGGIMSSAADGLKVA
ncbi:MAG: NAD(P)-binding protein, partial [Clostridia bacterium]